MRKITYIIFLLIILQSCKKSNNKNLQINAENLKGKWYLNKWTYYHTLDFDGDSIYVDNHIDSTFYLNYRLSKDTLITWSQNSTKLNKDRILKISKDTLVLNHFLNNKEEFNYSKTETKIEN